MITRAEWLAEVRSYLGTPYHEGAHLKGVGVDCIGVGLGAALHFNLPGATEFINDPNVRGYSRHPNPRVLIAACDKYLDRIPVGEGRPGDLALARVEVDPQHFCIISSLDPMRVIHAYIQMGKVVENIVDANWRSRVLRMFRFRGIE